MSMEPHSSANSRSLPLDDLPYTIIVRGEEFQLSRSQLSFDSPNYFTDCFSSGFAEAEERSLRLDRNPALFALIVDYLSGYPILPLTADSLPPGMGIAMANRCLLADARYYNLQRLLSLMICPAPSDDLGWIGLANRVVRLDDVLRSQLPDGVVRESGGSIVSEDTRRPVLIDAQNVLFRLVETRHFTKGRFTRGHIHFELQLPPDTLDAHSPMLTIADLEPDGAISIDGVSYMLSDIRTLGGSLPSGSWRAVGTLSELHRTLTERGCHETPQDPQVETGYPLASRSYYTFWADMVTLAFPSESGRGMDEGTMGNSDSPLVRLLQARLRSKHMILQGLGVRLVQGL